MKVLIILGVYYKSGQFWGCFQYIQGLFVKVNVQNWIISWVLLTLKYFFGYA